MEFEEYKKERIEALRESVRFFSNDGKKESEVWVVEKFLDALDMTYTESEIIRLTQKDEPPDVTFRDANFEVMELYDEERLRCKEYTDMLNQMEAATSYNDILKPETWDIEEVSLHELLATGEERLHKKKGHFSADVKATLDVLIYVNIRKITITDEDNMVTLPEVSKLAQWRSVAFIFDRARVSVVYASDSAPDFIQDIAGKVIRK